MKRKKILALIISGILLSNLFMGERVLSVSAEEDGGTSFNVEESGEYLDAGQEESNPEQGVGEKIKDEGSEINEEDSDDGKLVQENVSSDESSENSSIKLGIMYQAHVQNIGWQSEVYDGKCAGTTGRNLNLEALRIKLNNESGLDGSVVYNAHVQDIGWKGTVSENELAGTEGKGKAIEAIKIQLTGEIARKYDVFYRVHVTNMGWLPWAKNGELAGTEGFAYAAQAIEIVTYEKESKDAPITSGSAFVSNRTQGNIVYQAHVQNRGWLKEVSDGELGGTVGENRNLEAFRIYLSDEIKQYGDITGEVEYQAYIRDKWTNKKANGAVEGTMGQNIPIQAVKINLSGKLAELYDIYYRIHSANYGWLGWAKSGEIAGTMGLSCPAQAIEIKIVAKNETEKPVQDSTSYISEENLGTLVYKAHVEDIGWQTPVKDGQLAGTTGQGKQIEALSIKLSKTAEQSGIDGHVVYQAHVQDYGWLDEVCDGEIAGTTGENKRVEAVRINLSGIVENAFDIYYRVHVSNFGWLGWAKNGETAGTSDYRQRMEAIEIRLVKKDAEDKPEQAKRSYLSKELIGGLTAESHVEDIGWQSAVGNGGMLGTTGQNRSIQAIKLNVESGNGGLLDKYTGGIRYSLHVENLGWMNWVENGELSGTVGKNLRSEAVKIELTGELKNYADIYYRAHVSEYGWLGWASNGMPAGTTKCKYKLQALEIRIVPKFAPAPGSTSNSYRETPKITWIMGLRSDLYSSPTPYLILVNRNEHKVGVFQGWQGNWNCIQYWDCANGKPSTPTVGGIFQIGSRGVYFDSGAARCHWWTQFYGDYLFHSVLYNKNGTIQDGRVGMALSHGCVRLQIQNAKWIYDNIPSGTTVVVYN